MSLDDPVLVAARSKIESKKILSVLIPTLPTRLVQLGNILSELSRQIGSRDDIEVLALLDTKTSWLGDKRNSLMDVARGDYLTFVNDDDEIVPNWLERVTARILDHSGVDVISIQAECMKRDSKDSRWYHAWYMATSLGCKAYSSLNFRGLHGRRESVLMQPPCMWCIWRSDVARQARFSSKNYGEDQDFLNSAVAIAKTEVVVREVLYRYFADDDNSEAGIWEAQATPFLYAGAKETDSIVDLIDADSPYKQQEVDA